MSQLPTRLTFDISVETIGGLTSALAAMTIAATWSARPAKPRTEHVNQAREHRLELSRCPHNGQV